MIDNVWPNRKYFRLIYLHAPVDVFLRIMTRIHKLIVDFLLRSWHKQEVMLVCRSCSYNMAMRWHIFGIFSLLWLLLSVGRANWVHHIAVSVNGRDNSGCLININTPCLTLDFVFQHVLNQNSTIVVIQRGNYHLNASFTFTYIRRFAIVGATQSSGDVTINCSLLAGLSFIYSADIAIKHVTLASCGALHNSTSRGHPRFLAGLFFVNCIDLTLNDTCITDGPGIGMQLYDVAGIVQVLNSTFSKNGKKTGNLTNIGQFVDTGGGIYMEYTYSGGLWPFNQTANEQYQTNCLFQLFDVIFKENIAPRPNISDSVVVPSANDHVAFGRGGGVSMFIKGNAKNNTFKFNRCIFDKNNAIFGGAYFAEFHDNSQGNQVTFKHCRLCQNTVKVGGGGVRIGLITFNFKLPESTVPNTISFAFCHFEQNTAIFGGAVSMYSTTKASYVMFPERSFINFTSCVVKNNYATVGSAFGLSLWNTNTFGIGLGVPTKVLMMNCSIIGNRIIFTEDKEVVGLGALYGNGMPLVLESIEFSSNNGTALVLDNSVVQMKGNVSFKSNIGQNGGAVAIYGTSKIKVAKGVHLTFINNTCLENGGAVYVQTAGPQMVAFQTTELNTHSCFIASSDQDGFYPEKWKFRVTFQGNKAPHNSAGHSVFATTLQYCRQPGEKRINNTALQWKPFHYFFGNGSQSDMIYEIATSPVQMKVNSAEWNVTADKAFSPTLRLIDEKNQSVFGIIDIALAPKSEVRLSPPSAYYLAKDQINSIKIQGEPSTQFNVTLFTVKSQLVSHSISNVYIKSCSPGFVPHGSTCRCNSAKDIGISRCEDMEQSLFLVKGYWGGYVSSESDPPEFVTAPCPYNYCHCSDNKSHPSSDGECFFTIYKQCHGNRQGQLCGECKGNLSLKVGEDNCVDTCKPSYQWLGYLALLLLFLTTLVLIIVLINFDPFSAYFNAWLYSYQVILLLLPESLSLDPFLLFIVGLANVRFLGLGGVCMWSNMDDLQKLAFNYLLPVYVILCLLILKKLSSVCNNCLTQRLTQTSIARALCTLIVLCYSTVTYISLNILYPVRVGNKYFVYYQGTEEFFGSYHLRFAIPALFLLIFVGIVFPLMLIRRQWFSKIDSGLKRLLLDNFQNPFRNGYKWCSGFYFVCRFILLLISIAPPGALKVSLQQSACSIIFAIFVLCRPYDESDGLISFKLLNISDAILLCNLCLLTNFSGALSGIYAVRSYYNPFKVVIYMLGYVPLAFSFGILVYFVRVKYCKAQIVLDDLIDHTS